MVREIRRGLLGVALLLVVGPVTALQAQQRYKVLVPDLRPENGSNKKFGENVAKELRSLIDEMATHQAVSKREMDQGFRDFKVDTDTVSCAGLQHVANQMEVPLALCAGYTEAPGGFTINAEFFDVRSGESLKVSPVTVPENAEGQAAEHISGEFERYTEELRSSAICAEYVASEIWDQALEVCGRSIELNPDAIRPRFLRARVLFQTERVSEALDDLKGVLELNPAHQDALQMAGYIATQLHQDDAALDFYFRYLDVVPGAVAVRSKIAYDLAQAGDFSAAVVIVQEGLEHDSTDVDLWDQLGGYAFSAARELNSGDPSDTTGAATVNPAAVPFFRTGLDAYEHVFAARGAETPIAQLRSMVAAYMVLGEMDNAAAMAERALATYADDADLWWIYCDALHRADRLPDAISALDKVLALDPSYPQAKLRKGQWLLEAGRLTEATAVLSEIAASDPTQADAAGGILVAYAYSRGIQPKRWSAAIAPLEAARGIPGLSGDTNNQVNFWLAFSIMQGAIPEQEPRTVETARATLPKFQRARELLRLAGDYPRKINVDLATLVTTIEQYIEIQNMIIRRGR